MHHSNESPWASLINMIITGLFGYMCFQEGKRAMAHEIHHEAMQWQVDDLRKKLDEQNRVNEQVRRTLGI